MTEPHVIFEMRKNEKEIIRMTQDEFKGHAFYSIRLWYRNDNGQFRPSQKGVTIKPEQFNEFMQGIKHLEAAHHSGGGEIETARQGAA